VKRWLAAALLGLTACASGAAEPDAEGTVGEENAAYEGPIGSQDVAAGKEVFSTFCDDCHPDGEEDVGPSLIADPHSPPRLRQQIREGSGRMRPFDESKISPEDLEHLLAFLDSINAVSK
jgi:cytochrome c5